MKTSQKKRKMNWLTCLLVLQTVPILDVAVAKANDPVFKKSAKFNNGQFSVGRTECIWKDFWSNNYFNLQPLAEAYPVMYLPSSDSDEYFDPITQPELTKSYFVFGWCQLLDQIEGNEICAVDAYAA